MTGVSLDTSGYALTPSIEPGLYNTVVWSDLSPFEQGYTAEAMRAACKALWPDAYRNGVSMMAFSDWAPETLAAIRRDCEEQRKGFAFIGIKELSADVGRDFWKMRQAACAGPMYPPLTPTLGDDGKVRFQ